MSKTFSVQKMAIIALMTAVLCILAPISIPVFISPVPISLGVLAIYLTAYVLSPVDALISVIIFILLGTLGFLCSQDIQADSPSLSVRQEVI